MRVVLLCGGKGTRLSEETRVTPKPLVEIGGIPIVSHIINQFLDFGFSDFILATGYKSENFEEYFSSENSTRLVRDFNGRYPHISIENTGLETLTGGRVLRLKELLSKEDKFMLTYGDGVSNVDILKLQDFHNTHGRIASVTAVRPPARFGVIRIDDQSRVEYFQEKDQTDAEIAAAKLVMEKERVQIEANKEANRVEAQKSQAQQRLKLDALKVLATPKPQGKKE